MKISLLKKLLLICLIALPITSISFAAESVLKTGSHVDQKAPGGGTSLNKSPND